MGSWEGVGCEGRGCVHGANERTSFPLSRSRMPRCFGGMVVCGYSPAEARRLGAGNPPASAGSVASRPVDRDASTKGRDP